MPSESLDHLQNIVRKLALHKDSRLKQILEEPPDRSITAELLSAHIEVGEDFDVRYLAPGRSGSKVVLVNYANRLPVVIKFGPTDEIQKEFDNYQRSQVVAKLPPEIAPKLNPTRHSKNRYESIAYSWAGGWDQVETFRSFFNRTEIYSDEDLKTLLVYLMTKLFRWHDIKRASCLPFDQWNWEEKTLVRIEHKLRNLDITPNARDKLLGILQSQEAWRNALMTKVCSSGTCHGDFNCHNILMARSARDYGPKIIDFASVGYDTSPARDWAKLEREIKLRCLRDMVKEPLEFNRLLEQVDNICNSAHLHKAPDARVNRVISCISTIRAEYTKHAYDSSDLPYVEYLYFVLCWTLAYVNNDDFSNEAPEVQTAIIESAFRTFQVVDDNINGHEFPVYSVATTVLEVPDELDVIASEFLAQTRIVGHLENIEHIQRAIYLDNELYVHRADIEAKILHHVSLFSRSNESHGEWLNITGDAGHGKTCLLWYLYNRLHESAEVTVVPLQAQLLGNDPFHTIEKCFAKIQAARDRKSVIILDTLDILVGIDDPVLARTLNALRASGSLVITTCRNHEAEKIYTLVQADRQIELPRYSEEEAKEAIRKYIRFSYPTWTLAEKETQFLKIWDLLDQRRKVQELGFEPLVLRMIFEAYAPHDIPQDINTQKVYKKFWDVRILSDRVKDASERFKRSQICCLLAREIAFGSFKGHLETFSVEELQRSWQRKQNDDIFPFHILEDLVSTGVLHWARGKSAVRFFHQTFFEYVAAFDTLRLQNPIEKQQTIAALLSDVRNIEFFRVPILKQLAIQDFYNGGDYWINILNQLRHINTDFSAQLALEIAGKIEDDASSRRLFKTWIQYETDKLQTVVLESVKYYPKSRISLALDLLVTYLNSSKERAIYSFCEKFFAIMAPDSVYEFLHMKLKEVKLSKEDNIKGHFSAALSAVLNFGEVRALDDLAEIFKGAKPGLQSSLLMAIAESANETNFGEIATFCATSVDTVIKVGKREVREGFLKVLSRLYEIRPYKTMEIAQNLTTSDSWKSSNFAADLFGKIAGRYLFDEVSIPRALNDVASTDHYKRIMTAEILHEAGGRFPQVIMQGILALDKNKYPSAESIISLHRVVSGLKEVDSSTILRFLDDWPWPRGTATSIRDSFNTLTRTNPKAIKNWLLEKLDVETTHIRDKVVIGFSILAGDNMNLFDGTEIKDIYRITFLSSKRAKMNFSRVIGCIAKVDETIAHEIFLKVLHEEGKDCRTAAIASLRCCLNACPAFVLSHAELIVQTAEDFAHPGLLHSYLEILKDYPKQDAHRLFYSLDGIFTVARLNKLTDEKCLTELLRILKIFCGIDPALALLISKRCRLVTKPVVEALAALFENITGHTNDSSILEEVLEGFRTILTMQELNIGNTLRRALPVLDRKLRGKQVVEMISGIYREIHNERILADLVIAALKVPSFSEENMRAFLKDPHLPNSVRGMLLAKRVRA